MNSFKSDGVYLSVNDKRKNGYLTWGSDGKLKKHNYGIVDKLYDLYYYGKTKEIQYNYIHFYSSRRNTNNELIMSFGTVEGDIMSVLEYFKSSKFHISHQNKIDFTYINENKEGVK